MEAPPPSTAPLVANRNMYIYSDYIRLFLVILIVVAAPILLFVFFTWLPYFQVTNLSLRELNVSGNKISGNFDTTFKVLNPCLAYKVDFDEIHSSISYKTATLSMTTIEPFSQGIWRQRSVNANFAVNNSYVDEWVVNEINECRAIGKAVAFDVTVEALVEFKVGAIRAKRRLVHVLCQNVIVGLVGFEFPIDCENF